MKYILFTDADFKVFLAEMAMLGGYGDLIFLHGRSFGGIYISEANQKKASEAGLKLYSDTKAVEKMIKKGVDYSEQTKELIARYPEAEFKDKTPAELKWILKEYYAVGIPFLKIYSFTEGIYSPLIDKTIRSFIFQSIKEEEQAARAFGILLNPIDKKKVIGERERILKDTVASGIIINLCRSVRKMGKAKFAMRKTLNQSYGFLTSLLKVIAHKNYFSEAQMQACKHCETEAILEGKKIDTRDINKRVKCFAAFYQNGKPEFFTGKAAQKITDRVKFTVPENIMEFKGDPASAGRATGRVKIIPVIMARSGQGVLRAKIREMKKGDILVANTTGPEMVMACKKAGAIVANEGGINSHAAIVSRELGIPGIVNTKIATQVLKDGDIIEVDANSGTVKIIKKSE
jgi:phosphohistidine swiveling domain-containing protein